MPSAVAHAGTRARRWQQMLNTRNAWSNFADQCIKLHESSCQT
jgi:hypothetical protein